jgi:5-methylcytosine-specific restriction endonuclease McrA
MGKNKREVEHQMAILAPKPDVKSIIRRFPEPTPSATRAAERAATGTSLIDESRVVQRAVASSTPRAISSPLSSDRYLLRVTLTGTAHEKLRRAQNLMRHSVPDGDPATIVARALELLVDDLERRRFANVKTTRRPMPHEDTIESGSRHVPAAVRREVWKRDAGRCAFVGTRGRCAETGQLEFHHVEPFAFGGQTTTANIELRCRAHNQYEGGLLFGLERDGVDTLPR